MHRELQPIRRARRATACAWRRLECGSRHYEGQQGGASKPPPLLPASHRTCQKPKTYSSICLLAHSYETSLRCDPQPIHLHRRPLHTVVTIQFSRHLILRYDTPLPTTALGDPTINPPIHSFTEHLDRDHGRSVFVLADDILAQVRGIGIGAGLAIAGDTLLFTDLLTYCFLQQRKAGADRFVQPPQP